MRISLYLLLFVLFNLSLSAQETQNVALDAEVTTSYVSPWETLEAVNDGIEPSSSADNSNGAYGNWNGDASFDTYNWVQYEWPFAVSVSSTSVYWWEDGGGILKPTDAYIEYWDGLEWVNAGDIGTDLDAYNTLELNVTTPRIRVTMKSTLATGILEWQVMGSGGEDCEPTDVVTTVSVNDGEPDSTRFASVLVGDNVRIEAFPSGQGSYNWSGPEGLARRGESLTLENLQENQSGTYFLTMYNACGAISTANVSITVGQSNDGTPYEWPAYDRELSYDFRDEYPELEMPTQNLDDCEGVAGRISDGWWTFVWGPNRRKEVPDVAIHNMLDRLNNDFAYIRNVMGWPPDRRVQHGYRSAVYLYGSGLCTDNEDTTALGGWQGNINYEGVNYPMILASYYPVAAFDPSNGYDDAGFQMGAMVHEGIHAILTSLPGARNAAWFHEGGNTWLQMEMESRRAGDYSSMGFLNAGALIAPFMPIECYSGWLLDGSFGGPAAQGVNMFDDGQQICTWRNLLGGTQYGNMFPTLFAQIMGDKSIAWIWRYCENTVLEGIADSLGDYQTRRMIMEYRAKMALVDIGVWTDASRQLLDANFGGTIEEEWEPYHINVEPWTATPYVKTSWEDSITLVPEQRTTPGWSGSNIIPLIVEGDMVSANFIPIGDNMGAQLAYRATDGTTVYGQPVFGGEMKLKLDKRPANNVVFVIVTNTEYRYEGERTRTAHHDYRIQIGEGFVDRGHWHVPWYQWNQSLENLALPQPPEPEGPVTSLDQKPVQVYPNPVSSGNSFIVEVSTPGILEIIDIEGKRKFLKYVSGKTQLDSNLDPGVYFLIKHDKKGSRSTKLLIE